MKTHRQYRGAPQHASVGRDRKRDGERNGDRSGNRGGGALRVVRHRLVAAYRRRPGGRDWLEAGGVTVLFALIAYPIARAGGLIEADGSGAEVGTYAVALLAVRVLLVPALLEETLFRVMANPARGEGVGWRRTLLAAMLSTCAYLLIHPVAGLLRPGAAAFLRPTFLLLAALLGGGCLFLYRRSGSVWTPTAFHGLAAVTWLSFGGPGVLDVA